MTNRKFSSNVPKMNAIEKTQKMLNKTNPELSIRDRSVLEGAYRHTSERFYWPLLAEAEARLEEGQKIYIKGKRLIHRGANSKASALLEKIVSLTEKSKESLCQLTDIWAKNNYIIEQFEGDEHMAANEFFFRSQAYYPTFEELIGKLAIYSAEQQARGRAGQYY